MTTLCSKSLSINSIVLIYVRTTCTLACASYAVVTSHRKGGISRSSSRRSAHDLYHSWRSSSSLASRSLKALRRRAYSASSSGCPAAVDQSNHTHVFVWAWYRFVKGALKWMPTDVQIISQTYLIILECNTIPKCTCASFWFSVASAEVFPRSTADPLCDVREVWPTGWEHLPGNRPVNSKMVLSKPMTSLPN